MNMTNFEGLFVHCKDTNLKAIHNKVFTKEGKTTRLFVHCKDTNLKAIHNLQPLYPCT